MNFKEYYLKRETQDVDYEESYWQFAFDPDGKRREMSSEIEQEHKRILAATEINFINSLKPGKILDVGCGNGAILDGIDNKWDKYGVEISKYAADIASKKNMKIFNGSLYNAKYLESSFDVILLFHVIEHMLDPMHELNEIRRILKPNGHLIIGTPDFDSACARRYGSKYRMLSDSTHTSLFTNESLSRMLLDFGFEVFYTDFPYFNTEYFNLENLKKLFDTNEISPPFYGNIMTKYAKKLKYEEAIKVIQYKIDFLNKLNR